MKNSWKLTIAAILTVFVFSGCTKASDKPSETTTPAASVSAAATVTPGPAKANDFGWVKPAVTTVIDFYQGDRDNPDKVAKKVEMMHKYLMDNFNVNLKRTVYDIDPKEKLNLMLVSGDYTPVIAAMDSDNMAKWQSQGKLQDLAPLVEKYAPGIKKELGDKYKMYLDKDGHLWGLPRGWGYLPIPDNSAHIRWDWYTQMGSPKIETPDDYYNVIKKMVEAHPKNTKGEKVYGISWNDQVKIEQIMGFWGLKEGYKEDGSNNLTHWVNTPEGLAAVQYYNKFFREGLLDPEAFLNKFDDWKSKFSNERIVGHIGPWWQSWNAGHEIWKTLPNFKEDMRYVQIGFKAPGADKAYLSAKDTTGWNYTVITDKAKNPEEIIKFLEFEMSPMGTRLLGWGIPNLPDSVWTFDGSKWAFTDSQKQLMLAGKYNYDRGEEIGGNVYWLVHQQGLLGDDNKSTAWYDQNFNQEDKWKKLMNDNLKDTIFDNTARRVVFTPDNPLTVKNQQIEDAVKAGFVKAVMSKTEADSLNNFNTLKDNLNKLGLHDIEKFRTDEYKKSLAKLK